MADPVTWMIIGSWTAAGIAAAGSIGSAAVGIASAVNQQKQAEANADAQAQQLEYNKRLQEREAAAVEQETAANARRQFEEDEALKARQRALLGKSGAALATGSPLAILGKTAADQNTAQHDIMYKGYREAEQLREQGKQYGYQASLAKASAKAGRSGTNLAILGNVISGTTGTVNALGQGISGHAYANAWEQKFGKK